MHQSLPLKPKTHKLSILLDEDTRRVGGLIAKDHDVSLAHVIRIAINRLYLQLLDHQEHLL